MAHVPETTSAGQSWSRLATGGIWPDELRKKGIDEATRLLYLTRKYAGVAYYLHRNVGKTKKVKDRIFKAREVTELDRYLTVTVPSGQGSDAGVERVFGLSNEQAVQIQPNDVLYVRGLYVKPQLQNIVFTQALPNVGTNLGPDLAPAGFNTTDVLFSRVKGMNTNNQIFADEEQMLVVDVGPPDSAGTGNTLVTVDRVYQGPNANDDGGRIIPAAIRYGNSVNQKGIWNDINNLNAASRIQAGDRILMGMSAWWEGTNYGTGIFKNPVSDVNFTQEYKMAVEKTEESDIVDYWIKERPFDINRWITSLKMTRSMEYSYLLGKKGMDRRADGRELYLTGGIREFILKDSQHYIVYPSPTLTWTGMLQMSRSLLDLNNSGNMKGITGVSMDVALRSSFWNSNMFYNPEASKKFNMEVNTIVLAGVSIDLVVSQVFEENGLGNEIMLLDFADGDAFTPVTNEGWDMKVEKDIAEKGSSIYKEGIKGMFGLERRRQTHHAIWDFSAAVPII